MPGSQPPETDLILTLPPEGEQWDPCLIHTHYFGFCVPEANIGAFVYMRYQPAFPLHGAGVMLYQGLDNVVLSDSLHHDYQITLPWPEIDGNRIRSSIGLEIDFVEPGKHVRLTYAAPDGHASFELEAVAITPLSARGHVLPGEDVHASDAAGGSEQFMHYTGTVTVKGETHKVDCLYPRDRSWGQVRAEERSTPGGPPLCWTPVAFDDALAFNQIGIEDAPEKTFYAWISRGGELRDLTEVRRTVTKRHPRLHAPLNQEIIATDAGGDTLTITGEGIAFVPLPGWHNLTSYETLTKWTTEDGRVGYGPAQSVWTQDTQHALNQAS